MDSVREEGKMSASRSFEDPQTTLKLHAHFAFYLECVTS